MIQIDKKLSISMAFQLRFNQVEFKTSKTEANAIALHYSLVDMPNRENIVWYTNGQYQGRTVRWFIFNIFPSVKFCNFI